MTMLPQEFLDSHALTAELKLLGVTDHQLEQTQFRSNNIGWPFDQWSMISAEDLPPAAFPLLKAYCALKWLVLSDPPASRDTEDAWRLVADTMAVPAFAAGLRYIDAQAARGRKPRGLITQDGKDIKAVIWEFYSKPGNSQIAPKQLWPKFFAELDGLGFSPQEIDPQHYRYSDFKGGKRRISYGYFANTLSRLRN